MQKVNCFQCSFCKNIYTKASAAQNCESEHGLVKKLTIDKCIGYSKSETWPDLVIMSASECDVTAVYQLYKVE